MKAQSTSDETPTRRRGGWRAYHVLALGLAFAATALDSLIDDGVYALGRRIVEPLIDELPAYMPLLIWFWLFLIVFRVSVRSKRRDEPSA